MKKIDIVCLNAIPIILFMFEIMFIYSGHKWINDLKKHKDVENLFFEPKIQKKYQDSSFFEIIMSILEKNCKILLIAYLILVFIFIKNTIKLPIANNTNIVIDNIPSLILTGLMGIVACLGIFAKWVKIDSLVFNLNDIYEKTSIVNRMKKMTFCSVFAIIMEFLKYIELSEQFIDFINTAMIFDLLIFLYDLFFEIYLFIDICTGSNIERKILKQLYKNYWYDEYKTIDREENSLYKLQIRYLLRRFVIFSNKAKIKNIKNIKYNTNLFCDKRFCRLKKRSTLFISAFACAYVIGADILLKTIYDYNFNITELIIHGVFLVQLIPVGFFCRPLSLMSVLCVYGRCGYEVQYGKYREHYKYINDRNKIGIFCKYITTIKSIMAYADMAVNNKEIREFFIEECEKISNSGQDVEMVIVLINWIFSHNRDNDLRNIEVVDNSKTMYATEFIKDCYYLFSSPRPESIQKIVCSDKRNKKMPKLFINSVIIWFVFSVISMIIYFFTSFFMFIFFSFILIGAVFGSIFIIVVNALVLNFECKRHNFPEFNPNGIDSKALIRKGNEKKTMEVNCEHCMLEEINEQPRAIADTLHSVYKDGVLDLSSVGLADENIKKISQIYIVACGSAYHVGVVAQYVMEDLAKIPVRVDVASEFRYRKPILKSDDLVIIISQSGETADSLAALRLAKEKCVKTLAIVNVIGSSIAREADSVFYTLAGPEIAVATTKAYSTQLIASYCLAIQFAKVRGELTEVQCADMLAELEALPDKVKKVLDDKERIQWFAAKQANMRDIFFIGRGIDYAVSLEGSLKLKEISYIHSEAYAAGELKHGTISLIEDGTLVIGTLTQAALYEKTVSNMVECKSRGAYLMGLTTYGNYETEDTCDFTVYIPKTDAHFTASLAVIPLQLLGYYVSVAKGLDVDKPRNLAKSVTVE